MAPETAIRIDNRYEVLGELGRGGMGIVYKANDLKMDRLVAIKVMTSHAPGRDEYQERFLREARSIAKMQHPNIVVVHDYGHHAGAPYMVMEYVEGIALDKVIASRVALAILTKVDYVVQVCHALHYAHQLKIVHRDVKPGNIMVLEGGRRVKLLDFGIARAAGVSTLSKSGLAMGTSCYMSPEQTKGQKDLDGRADIFSAGVVLYELLTGKPPWTGESDFEIMTKIVNDPYPLLSASVRSYPAGLDRVFERALAKEANSRYQTAEKMAQELSELEASLKEQALEDALVQFEQGDLLRASDLVSQILRIDTRYREALELRGKLQQVAQLHHRTEQVRQLKITAEQAVGQKRYTDALAAIEQAISIDAGNSELFHYRELVRSEVKRREDIRKKLQLAKRAQEINDLSTAQELVEKALEADPTDTHARMMKSSLEEEKKSQQQREIAEEVGRALMAHAFGRAQELIQQLELIDSAFPPLDSLKKKLAEGQAEEKRRQEAEEVVRDVRRVLETGDPVQSLAITEKAIARFPGEPRLLRLRTQAEALRDAAERERAIQETISRIKQLTEQKRYSEALALAERALKLFGGEYRLQASVAHLREAAERERQLRAEQNALAQARDAMQAGNPDSALKLLTAAAIEFPASTSIADALQGIRQAIARQAEAVNAENVRKLQITEALEHALSTQLDPDAQVKLAEEAAATISGNETAERVLGRVRERQRQITSAMERAQKFEQVRNFPESIREWQRVQQLYPEHPHAGAQIARLTAALESSSRNIAPAAVPAAPVDLSATSMMAAAISRAPSPAIEQSPTPVAEAPAPPVASVVESPAESPVKLRWQSKRLVGGGAVIVVVISVFVHFLVGPKKSPAPVPVTQKTPAAITPVPVPPRPNIGTLVVKTSVDKVNVFVDGELKSVTSAGTATIPLIPGPHKISVAKPGYSASAQQVEIIRDNQAQVQFELTKAEEASQVPAETYVIIRSLPTAKVWIDKKEVGQVPADGSYPIKTNSGRHYLLVMLNGFEPWTDTVKITSGETLTRDANLMPIHKPPVSITFFRTTSNSIKQGDEVQLSWETQNAMEARIDPDVGNVKPSDSISVKPTAARTIYRLTAQGEGPEQQRSVSIDVTEIPQPTINIFMPAVETIQQGKPGKLIWATQNATEVSISPELGAVSLSGDREVHPNSKTTYTLTAKGPGGTIYRQTTMTVESVPVAAAPLPQPAAQPVAPPEDPNIKAVLDTIQVRYKDAYESMETDELKKVWPSLPKPTEKRLKESFKAVRAIKDHLQCSKPAISGDSAKCTCSETLVFTYDSERKSSEPVSVVFELQKVNGSWRVANRHLMVKP